MADDLPMETTKKEEKIFRRRRVRLLTKEAIELAKRLLLGSPTWQSVSIGKVSFESQELLPLYIASAHAGQKRGNAKLWQSVKMTF